MTEKGVPRFFVGLYFWVFGVGGVGGVGADYCARRVKQAPGRLQLQSLLLDKQCICGAGNSQFYRYSCPIRVWASKGSGNEIKTLYLSSFNPFIRHVKQTGRPASTFLTYCNAELPRIPRGDLGIQNALLLAKEPLPKHAQPSHRLGYFIFVKSVRQKLRSQIWSISSTVNRPFRLLSP